MSCTHLNQIAILASPKLSQSVHREECTQCFDGQDSDAGIDVCLVCFNGGCLSERAHAKMHAEKTGHGFALNIKRRVKTEAEGRSKRAADEEPPLKMTKLAIVEEREQDKYKFITAIRCYKCNPDGVTIPDSELDAQPAIGALVKNVLATQSSARKSEVQAWEEEILPCEHTLTLQQVQMSKERLEKVIGQGAHCANCSLTSNLWLCLTCGNLGCGRAQFGGVEGNSHGLAHFEMTRDLGEVHPVSVKLGTITAEGNADIYCYVCNDSKLDPELAKHLATFGIRVESQQKTEKSMTELQIEHNLKYDFSLTGDDGRALEPLFGPGLTGLKNLGNSCYMASVLQTLFSLTAFQQKYGPGTSAWAQVHTLTCTNPAPAECVECQMIKVADGLLSGRYAVKASASTSSSYTLPADEKQDPNAPQFQEGLKPSMFKALVGRGHAEFATMRQQDSEEFLVHLIDVLRRERRRKSGGAESEEPDPTSVFTYGTEGRLQCASGCGKVRYRIDGGIDVLSVSVPAVEKKVEGDIEMDGKKVYEEVELTKCIDDVLLGAEVVDEWVCPECKAKGAVKKTRFASFPEVLAVHAKKFQLVNWVPAKLDIPVSLPPNDTLTFDEKYLGRGLQLGETELPEDKATDAPALPQFDEAAMAQLTAMGFPEVRCQKALLATGNSGADAAMEWLFAHMEDPDIDEPIQLASSAASASEPPAEQISMLVDMGFTPAQAKKALRETSGNVERAVEWLFSHPDTGEDSQPASGSSDTENKEVKLAGTKDVPVSYRLKAFISHKGPSVHSGHYVAHIKKDEGWVLFNDEKVVKADEESVKDLKKLAYLYIFEKA
ncbi:ubiquitin carboxyl-terminal hydrolase 14 [Moniliophthora roreri MCA 2997]|uniref:Ubiquitin carboxyl-terminal hydrolase n=1 Tax=Moniliophthora roreri (strain MCA 2997) TaxID=1381753 RepID=V2XI34_MONRO|nr:ubiquitin carboxyl-terminal hydrolase 14 [Moniliophthora roreri MCA 2997]